MTRKESLGVSIVASLSTLPYRQDFNRLPRLTYIVYRAGERNKEDLEKGEIKMSSTSQNDTSQPQNLAAVTATTMMLGDSEGPPASQRNEEQDRETATTAKSISSGDCGRSFTAHSLDSHTIHAHSAVPINTTTGAESPVQQDEEGPATTTTPTFQNGPVPSHTPYSMAHDHSAVPTITTTGSESEEEGQKVREKKQDERGEEQDLATTTTSTSLRNPVPSSTRQPLHNDTIHVHSAVPTITPTGHESQEESDEESRATTPRIEERRLPHRLIFHVAARGQSTHSLDSSNSVVTPAISTAGATVGDGEDMDGRATPGDGLLPWSGGSLVSNEVSTTEAAVGTGEEVETVITEGERGEDEDEERRRHYTVSASTEDEGEGNRWTSSVNHDEISSGGNGSDFELTLSDEAHWVVLGADPREHDRFDNTQTIVWEISRPTEEQQRDLQDALDIPFTPQTPTHTPVVPAHLSRGALAADHLIPALDLAADQGQQGRGEEGGQALTVGEDLQVDPRSETRSNDLTLVHSGEDGERHTTYSMGPGMIRVVSGPNQMLPEPEDRINVRLPNPDNLPTFQLLVTVPYRSGTIGPVRATFEVPPRSASGNDSEQTAMLNMEVDQIVHWPDGPFPGEGISIHENRRDTSATARFVAQLPQIPLSEIVDHEDRECPVCRELFSTDTEEAAQGEQVVPERPVRTPCNHIVGSQCLLRWLFGEPGYPPHDTCPTCRGQLEIPQSPESRGRIT